MTREYPPHEMYDSVIGARVNALGGFGFTERQGEFLVTVMVHSGCFLERQYCAFTGTVRGQNSREFMARLVARGFVRVIEPGSVRRGRLYHVHHKPLYEAIGQTDNRHRRLRILGRMVERVMILDAVLGDRHCWWLSPASDKWRFFCLQRDNYMRPENYPHITFGSGRQRTIRHFPDKLPIGIDKDRLSHLVFVYLVNRRLPVDFRQFLIRHADLFGFVSRWTLRLLVPPRFRKAVPLYKAALREELWTPLDPSVTKQLETYFPERQAQGGQLGDPDDWYLRQEFRKQGMPKIHALYRAWRREGDPVLWRAQSHTLRDGQRRGESHLEVEPLNRQYLQLSGEMDRDVWARRGPIRGPSENGLRLAPRFRCLLLTVSLPWLPTIMRRRQVRDAMHVTARWTPRRRSVPTRPKTPLAVSLSLRWRERPRASGRHLTLGALTGSFTPSRARVGVSLSPSPVCAGASRRQHAHLRGPMPPTTRGRRVPHTSAFARAHSSRGTRSRLLSRSSCTTIASIMLVPCSASSMLSASLRPGRRPGLRALTTPARGTARQLRDGG